MPLNVLGYQKWFQFGVWTGVTTAFTKYGLPVPAVFAVVSATLELVGGIALLVGLFTRWFGLLYICEFTITFFYVKLRLTGFVDGRIDLMMLAGAMLLVLAGSGKAAIDKAWGDA
ncbi:MAG: DoxX family protein [Candidatus Rokubacteria bacterium]|nr:DoxX family protein [Candidatus Rokubacteria bacterium]MBI2554080.1 DoxX family protein [Candidatus Rokubacteria bacterium]